MDAIDFFVMMCILHAGGMHFPIEWWYASVGVSVITVVINVVKAIKKA
jgi:hypothetical protein